MILLSSASGIAVLIELVVYYFIIRAVIKAVKGKKKSSSNSSQSYGYGSSSASYSDTQSSSYSGGSKSGYGSQTVGSSISYSFDSSGTSSQSAKASQSTKTTQSIKTTQVTRSTSPSGTSYSSSATKSTSTGGATESSVTDYLSEKAKQDQIAHAKEKREEAERINKKAGGRQAAERWLIGDPVPHGKHMVICGYCGAENLLPIGSRSAYSCYFCREPLQKNLF